MVAESHCLLVRGLGVGDGCDMGSFGLRRLVSMAAVAEGAHVGQVVALRAHVGSRDKGRAAEPVELKALKNRLM